jgi:hypothetical protein
MSQQQTRLLDIAKPPLTKQESGNSQSAIPTPPTRLHPETISPAEPLAEVEQETSEYSDAFVSELVREGAYAIRVPSPTTELERQGNDGVYRTRARLKKEGYSPILTNQDRSDKEEARPDILAKNTDTGRWEQFEVHNYRKTKYVSALLSYHKNVKKSWLPCIKRTVVMVNPITYTLKALKKLQQEEITLRNGLNDGAQSEVFYRKCYGERVFYGACHNTRYGKCVSYGKCYGKCYGGWVDNRHVDRHFAFLDLDFSWGLLHDSVASAVRVAFDSPKSRCTAIDHTRLIAYFEDGVAMHVNDVDGVCHAMMHASNPNKVKWGSGSWWLS